jgi:glycosyltransferase involved in cell wall biosynthesis
VRVHVVDPSAYTPPYDHALCAALAAAGADVDLYTSRFAYAEVPASVGYARHELFYRRALALPRPARRAGKLIEHVPDMLRYRRAARAAQVVHFQWLPVQLLDGSLLPAGRPLVLTAHDILPREAGPARRRAQRRLYERFDAIVVHSAHGRARLVDELGVPASRVHVIPHGALVHLRADGGTAALPAPTHSATEQPVVLFFGLLRPYKGLELLLDAWRSVRHPGELWIVGAPRMDVRRLHERAGTGAGVRFVERYVSDAELAAYFARADLVVLPYHEADQSGVLFTALAFGKPLVLSDVGGFPELARETGAARTFPAGDAAALALAMEQLLGDGAQRAEMSARALSASAGAYSWAAVARATMALYESLVA